MLNLPESRLLERAPNSVPPLSSTVATSLMLLCDTVAILGAAYFTYDAIIAYSPHGNLYLSAVVFLWLVTLSLLNFAGLYEFGVAIHPARRIAYVLISLGVAFLFLLAAAFSMKFTESFSRIWLSSFAALSAVSLVALRLALALTLRRLLSFESLRRNLAVVGDNEQTRRLLAALGEYTDCPVRVSGFFSDRVSQQPPAGGADDAAAVPDLEALVAQARQGLIDDVAIALPWSEDDRIMQIVERLRELPVNVYLVSDLAGFRIGLRAPPTHFGRLPLVEAVGKPMSGWDAVIKALEDYLLGALILVLIAPLLALIALAVKLDSAGPVIFQQKRLGFNNQPFNVFKFRTMYHGSELASGTPQATKGDPRVTRVGRFLRRWSLDELPQIFNVLNGSMSLVGPRPHALDHNEEFARRMQGYFARHRVKPGITGLAQVKGFRGETDTQEKLEGRIRNDIYYAENWSPSLDIQILLRTAAITVIGKNAY